MPAFQYWFTGGAFAAFLALATTVPILGYAWFRAAITESDSATQHTDAVAQKLKANRVKDLIGKALDTGKAIFVDTNLSDEQREKKASDWGTRTRDLIAAAYGDGEAFLLLDDSGYTFFSDAGNPNRSRIRNWIDGRMRRIGELLRRIDSLTVRSDFEPEKFGVNR
jgi:hypothetical protein